MLSSTIPKETRVKQLREEALKWTQCKCIWTGQQRNKQYNRGHCVFTWKPVTQNKEIPVSLTLTWTSRADCWQRLNWMYSTGQVENVPQQRFTCHCLALCRPALDYSRNPNNTDLFSSSVCWARTFSCSGAAQTECGETSGNARLVFYLQRHSTKPSCDVNVPTELQMSNK